MKKIILATLSVLCLVSCNQLEKKTEKKNDLTEENLKGKVKSIKETPYDAIEKFGQLEKGDVSYSVFFPSSFTIYNEKGNKIEVNGYNPDGSLYSKTTYKYDEKGNTIEQNIYYHGSRPAENYSYKYEYDKNNNWTQEIEYFNTIPVYITERIIEYYP